MTEQKPPPCDAPSTTWPNTLAVEKLRPWRTPAVLSLAEQAYEGDWSALGPLSDALEEAGCVGETCDLCGGDGLFHDPITRLLWSKHHPCQQCKGERRMPHPILAHLRGPGPHCRGCHVLSLLLGKD